MEKFLEDTDPQLESSNVLKKAVNNSNEKKFTYHNNINEIKKKATEVAFFKLL